MKQRYHCFRRENRIYYAFDTLTKKRQSLNTTVLEEARRFLAAPNEACKQPAINLQIAQVYLRHALQQLFTTAEAARNRYAEFFGLGCDCFAF